LIITKVCNLSNKTINVPKWTKMSTVYELMNSEISTVQSETKQHKIYDHNLQTQNNTQQYKYKFEDLEIKLGENIPPEVKEAIIKLINEYGDVFAMCLQDISIPPKYAIPHKIH